MTKRKFLKPENFLDLPSALKKTVSGNPDKTAIVYFNRKFSYKELLEYCKKMSLLFRSLGAKEKDRVAIWMPNLPQFVFGYFGALMNRNIVVPINFMSIVNDLKHKKIKEIKITEEIKAQIFDSQPRIIFMADFFLPIFNQIISEIGWKYDIVVTSPADFLAFPLNHLYFLKALKEGKYVNISKLAKTPIHILKKKISEKNFSLTDNFLSSIDLNEIAQLQYTGGTTGIPKAAILTHKNLIVNILQCREHLGDFLKDNQEITLGVLPFFHVYGLTVAMNATLLSLKGTLILVPSFHPKEIIHLIKKHKITIFPGVNKMFDVLVKTKGIEKVSSLKLVINGAGPINPQTCEKWKKLTRSKIVEGYGLSETSPVISVRLPHEPEQPSNIGKPLPGIKIKIIKEDGGLAKINQPGILWVKGPNVMSGYWNRPKETKKVKQNGWFNTGDIIYRDSSGYLHFVDRLKRLITVNGENIYPNKIEEVLSKHRFVSEVRVIGFKDQEIEKMNLVNPLTGETPVALIVPINSEIDGKKLINELEELVEKDLPKIYHPSYYFIFKTFEPYKTPLGKILDRKIKEILLRNKFTE